MHSYCCARLSCACVYLVKCVLITDGGECVLITDGGECVLITDGGAGECVLITDGGECVLITDGGECVLITDGGAGECVLITDGGECVLITDGDGDGGEIEGLHFPLVAKLSHMMMSSDCMLAPSADTLMLLLPSALA